MLYVRKCLAAIAIVLVVSLTGCAGVQIDSAARSHKKAAKSVELGDSKNEVLAILQPTQKNLSARYSKEPDRFLDGSDKVEIYYMRSGRQADGLTTDDEFTPYIFRNDVLVGIGWAAIGGPKTHGQVIQPAPVTNVNVEQTIER